MKLGIISTYQGDSQGEGVVVEEDELEALPALVVLAYAGQVEGVPCLGEAYVLGVPYHEEVPSSYHLSADWAHLEAAAAVGLASF